MIICADDYGMSQDINEAILDLARLKRISAVSCMAALATLKSENLKPLVEFGDSIGLGLHLVLTEEPPISAASEIPSLLNGQRFHRFAQLLALCFAGQIKSAEVKKEIKAQYDAFVEKTQRAPDFIDGHLHVQQFPCIREGLLDFVMSLPKDHRPYIRNAYMPLRKIVHQGISVAKNYFISLPAKRFVEMLHANGIKTNHGFSGVYDYRQYQRYGQFLKIFLDHMETETGILMVHPGTKEAWRLQEYETLRESPYVSLK